MFTSMKLETERLIIRPLTISDAESLQVICSDKEVMRYLPEDVMTLDDVREIIQWLQECYLKNTPEDIIKFTVGVEHQDTGTLIGWCGLGPLEYEPSKIELFCGIARRFWSRGYATESCRAMLDYGYTVIGLDSIAAVVHPDNTASRRVIEKTGFIFREQLNTDVDAYGDYINHHYYALTHQDYDILRVDATSTPIRRKDRKG